MQGILAPQVGYRSPEIGEKPCNRFRCACRNISRRREPTSTLSASWASTNSRFSGDLAIGRFREILFTERRAITSDVPREWYDILLVFGHYNCPVSSQSARDPLVLDSDTQAKPIRWQNGHTRQGICAIAPTDGNTKKNASATKDTAVKTTYVDRRFINGAGLKQYRHVGAPNLIS